LSDLHAHARRDDFRRVGQFTVARARSTNRRCIPFHLPKPRRCQTDNLIASLGLLGPSLKTLPLGTAYAI
jgi:hypothetical protein